MAKSRISYPVLVEKAKKCGSLRELSEVVGVNERALRRRFQRKGTSFSKVKGGIEERPVQKMIGGKLDFLKDLRANDPYAVGLNRKLIALKVERNKLISERRDGWEKRCKKLTELITEYEDMIKSW